MPWCLDELTLEELDVMPLPTAGDGGQPVTEELDTLPLACAVGPGPGGAALDKKYYSGDSLAQGLGMN